MSEIRKMGSQPSQVQAYRGGKWQKISSEELLPGDLVSVGRPKDGLGMVTCDILLLRGSCIVDEAMLTGESVPQMKEPLDDSTPQLNLDLGRDSRLHVISGGTKVVQHSPPDRAGLRPSDGGCVGFVLRTGFNTSQGKLLRTILYGVKRVTANNLETFVFILFLLVFAVTASTYVWVKGTEDPERNRYKLFLECTLILTSVVPPELPIELSLAVNTSLIALTKLGIYCTEPFRIPFGGKVDVCCFDKTGTLTSNNLAIKGIAGIASGEEGVKHDLIPARESPFETQCVLATCHSLVLLEGDLVGDPMEKVALNAVDWNLSKGDAVTSRKGRRATLKTVHRFHFSSSLKRMSVITAFVPAQSSGHTHLVTVKGAPEILKEMFSSVPGDYDRLYSKLTRHGARVLALGYKYLNPSSPRALSDVQRKEAERDLTFAGFLAISCPLKEESKTSISCLLDSSHNVIMLTGDNPLTACHVAKELKIATRKTLVLTEVNEGVWHWQSVGGGTTATMETSPAELGKTFDLCLTGDAMAYVQSLDNGRTFDRLLPYITVFARVAPKQKETVVTSYRRLGYHTLMCGDGTNDVGALKHAHVGVALLSTVPLQKTTPTESGAGRKSESATPTDPRLARRPLHPQSSKSSRTGAGAGQAPSQAMRDKRLREMLKQMDEASLEPQLVRLGDASIASPFTSRHSSISCICHVIKQGRCTLVTTLQMFKILALNALVLAYSQSVLFLDGIKFSDTQATMQGILLAGCFLFISRSKPLTTLSQVRPLPNIFNVYTILTVLGQFMVHFSCLVYLVQEATAEMPESDEEFVDLEKEFEQNELNSAVYLISMAMQISNFAVNYKGHPFMASLLENKPLLYSLLATTTVLFLLATGFMPELGVFLEISPFTDEFRRKLLVVLVADFLASYALDRILSFFLGHAKLKTPR
jgi:cation-transporting ATPase 13A1